MSRIDTDEWIDAHDAARILTANSGHAVSDHYVRRLAASGAIRKKLLHDRLAFYNRRDAEGYRVQKRQAKNKARAELLLEPWRLDIMARVSAKKVVERVAKKLGVPLDEKQLAVISEQAQAVIREEMQSFLQAVKETGEIQNPDE